LSRDIKTCKCIKQHAEIIVIDTETNQS